MGDEILMMVIGLKITDIQREIDMLKSDIYFFSISDRVNYLKGKLTALNEVIELLKVEVK